MTTRTRTIGRHGATIRKAGWLASGLMLAVAALAPTSVGAAQICDQAVSVSLCQDETATDTTSTDTTTTSTDTTTTSTDTTDTVSETTDSTTEVSDTTTETTDQTTETTDQTTETTDSTTDTTDTTTETTDTTTETTDTSDTTTETTDTSDTTTETTDTSDTTTETSDTTTTDTTTTLTGQELPAVGTPGVTPPPTDALGSVVQAASTDGFRMLLVGLALVLGLALFLLPKAVTSKK